MTDWTLLAKAAGLDIPAKELGRIAQPLKALEEVFRPLVENLPPDLEPAAAFRPQAGGGGGAGTEEDS
jgi:hypothetical protein